jgi:hypothetical protein
VLFMLQCVQLSLNYRDTVRFRSDNMSVLSAKNLQHENSTAAVTDKQLTYFGGKQLVKIIIISLIIHGFGSFFNRYDC